jgi:uncharacterized protein
MRVTSLVVYPVKGARGISLDRAEILSAGIRHDRRFMILDAQGSFVTQREHPKMALVDVAFVGTSLRMSVKDAATGTGTGAVAAATTIALEPSLGSAPMRRVKIFDDEVDAMDLGGDGAAFFSEYLGESCSLVYMPLEVERPVEEPYAKPGDRVGFADAYPILIASTSSLDDLNRRLVKRGSPLAPMTRFRPNIVIDGDADKPYAEDEAKTVRIGSLLFRTPKPSARCQVVSVDPETAAISKEPLKTLATYRTKSNKVLFAINAIPDIGLNDVGSIAVGDEVTFDP